MEKKIDIVLKEIFGDDSFQDSKEETKISLAVLLNVYNRTAKLGLQEDVQDFMEEMGFGLSVNIPAVMKHLRDIGILNDANDFRFKKDLDSPITWLLFGSAIDGTLKISKAKGKPEYSFSITEEGEKMVMDMLKKD